MKNKKLQVGDTVYCYEVELDFLKNEATKKVKEAKILGINDDYIVLDDNCFTELQFKKEKYNCYPVINNSSSYHMKYTFTDKIISTLYAAESNEKKAYAKVKKELESFLYEKFGKYTNGIDLLNKLEI